MNWPNHSSESGQIGGMPVSRLMQGTRLAGQGMAAPAHLRPVVRRLIVDGCRHRQVRRRVTGGLPLVEVHELALAWRLIIPAKADDQGFQPGLRRGPSVEKRCPLGSAHPLVARHDVDIGAQGAQVQGNLAGGVGAVDDGDQAGRPGAPANLLDGKDQRRRAGDMAEEDNLRLLRDAGPECLDEPGLRRHGQRHVLVDVTSAGLAAHVAPGAIHGPVLVVGGEDLVAGLEAPGAGVAGQARATALKALVGFWK